MRHRVREELRPQIGGADRNRVVDDRGAPGVVAAHGHRQPERENERDEAEQCRLDDTEWLAQRVGVDPKPVANERPQQSGSEHDPKRITPSSKLLSRKNIGSLAPRLIDHARRVGRGRGPQGDPRTALHDPGDGAARLPSTRSPTPERPAHLPRPPDAQAAAQPPSGAGAWQQSG